MTAAMGFYKALVRSTVQEARDGTSGRSSVFGRLAPQGVARR